MSDAVQPEKPVAPDYVDEKDAPDDLPEDGIEVSLNAQVESYVNKPA